MGYLAAINRFQWRALGGFRQVMALARLGAVHIIVPEGAELTPGEWETLDLPARFLGQPLAGILREALAPRWPDVTATPEGEAAGPLPIIDVPDGADLEQLLGRFLR